MERKIAVLSDSHDNIDNLKTAVDKANSLSCANLIHLGDIVSPLAAKILGNFKGEVNAVFGNCDGDRIGLNRVFSEVGGSICNSPFKLVLDKKLFVLMHSPVLLEELTGKVDYILYGHLHVSEYKKVNNTIIVNPGETAGISNDPTMSVIDMDTNQVNLIPVKQ